jgi:hypothetical protein
LAAPASTANNNNFFQNNFMSQLALLSNQPHVQQQQQLQSNIFNVNSNINSSNLNSLFGPVNANSTSNNNNNSAIIKIKEFSE